MSISEALAFIQTAAGILQVVLGSLQCLLAIGAIILAVIFGRAALDQLTLARLEFDRSQRHPNLAVGFHAVGPDKTGVEQIRVDESVRLRVPSGATTPRDPGGSGPAIPLQIAVLNTGPVVAVWYLVEFRIPSVIRSNFQLVTGVPLDYWKIAERSEDDTWQAAFFSNGSIAAYPNYPQILCQILIPPRAAEYAIPYKLASDDSPLKTGTLKLSVVLGDGS